MPVLSWSIYQGYGRHDDRYLWFALIAGVFIGSTDWVDGMLARHQGPTVLGGLLDPIADKVFIAFAYTPFADTGLVPWWACALMFVREFFITALRSAYEQRDLTLKTSYLGKAKTWTQMQGIGVMLLFPLVDNRTFLIGLLLTGLIGPIVAMLGLWLIKKKLWRGALWMSASFAAILVVFLYDARYAPRAIMIGVVAITWISGLDYIAVGWKQLRGRGDFTRADGVRLLGSLALPILLFSVLVHTAAPRWTIFVILAFELAVGGLDNLLSHHRPPPRRSPGAVASSASASCSPARSSSPPRPPRSPSPPPPSACSASPPSSCAAATTTSTRASATRPPADTLAHRAPRPRPPCRAPGLGRSAAHAPGRRGRVDEDARTRQTRTRSSA